MPKRFPEFEVVLQRHIGKQVDQKKNLEKIKARAVAGGRGTSQGWVVSHIAEPVQKRGEDYIFQYRLRFKKTKGKFKDEAVFNSQRRNLVIILDKLCAQSQWGNQKWRVVDVALDADGNEEKNETGPRIQVVEQEQKFYEIKPQWDGVFDNLFDLNHVISLLTDSIDTAAGTQYEVRPHTLLMGPPGCGKTTLLQTAVESLGPEDEAFFRLDATSTTKAGVEKKLLDRNQVIPPIMLIEELEKVDSPIILKFLLGLLDDRSEINKLNYRIGHDRRKVKLLCLATVNDMAKLTNTHAGAVASRFTNQLFCPRPTRDVVAQILRRDVDTIYGKIEHRHLWIEPTLKYVYDEEQNTDPRRSRFVCLVGRDKLLNGSFQESLRKSRLPKEYMVDNLGV